MIAAKVKGNSARWFPNFKENVNPRRCTISSSICISGSTSEVGGPGMFSCGPVSSPVLGRWISVEDLLPGDASFGLETEPVVMTSFRFMMRNRTCQSYPGARRGQMLISARISAEFNPHDCALSQKYQLKTLAIYSSNPNRRGFSKWTDAYVVWCGLVVSFRDRSSGSENWNANKKFWNAKTRHDGVECLNCTEKYHVAIKSVLGAHDQSAGCVRRSEAHHSWVLQLPQTVN